MRALLSVMAVIVMFYLFAINSINVVDTITVSLLLGTWVYLISGERKTA